MTFGTVDFACLCSLDDNENIVAYNATCPLHKHLATPQEIQRRWCSGSSEPVSVVSKRKGMCRACRSIVDQKYGYASVHYPDGGVPRE